MKYLKLRKKEEKHRLEVELKHTSELIFSYLYDKKAYDIFISLMTFNAKIINLDNLGKALLKIAKYFRNARICFCFCLSNNSWISSEFIDHSFNLKDVNFYEWNGLKSSILGGYWKKIILQ